MKLVALIILGMFNYSSIYSQDYERPYYFSKITLDSNIEFKSDLYAAENTLWNYKPIRPFDFNMSYLKFDTKNLNTKLFSNLEITENNSFDYSEYLRGCGPLENGISNSLDSKDLMLSMFIDNLINTYIFKGKGILFGN